MTGNCVSFSTLSREGGGGEGTREEEVLGVRRGSRGGAGGWEETREEEVLGVGREGSRRSYWGLGGGGRGRRCWGLGGEAEGGAVGWEGKGEEVVLGVGRRSWAWEELGKGVELEEGWDWRLGWAGRKGVERDKD